MQVASSGEPYDAVVAGGRITPKSFSEQTPTWQMPSPEVKKTRQSYRSRDLDFKGAAELLLTVRACDYITHEYAEKA